VTFIDPTRTLVTEERPVPVSVIVVGPRAGTLEGEIEVRMGGAESSRQVREFRNVMIAPWLCFPKAVRDRPQPPNPEHMILQSLP